MHGHLWHTPTIRHCRSFFLCVLLLNDLFDNSIPFDNTTLIYLIILLWKLGLRLELDLELHYFFRFFHGK